MVAKLTNEIFQDKQLNFRERQYHPALNYLINKGLQESDLYIFLKTSVSLIEIILKAKYVRLWLFLSDGQTIEEVCNLVEAEVKNSEQRDNLKLPIEVKNYLETNTLINFNNNVDDKNSLVKLLPESSFKKNSGLIILIKGQEESLGFLEIYSDESRVFSEKETEFLIAVSHILATAISRKRLEKLLSIQTKILESLTAGTNIYEICKNLCLFVDGQASGSYCSILLYEAKENLLLSVAAPNLAPTFTKEIEKIPIKEGAGSCGTAAYRKKPVFVNNIHEDPLWNDYRHLACEHGINACWSTPFFSQNGDLLGTFAIYHSLPCEPNNHHKEIIKTATHLASIAIEAVRNTNELIQHALYDSLTGLPNRIFFINELRSRIITQGSIINWPDFAVLFLDVDNFKLINDSLGHSIGDQFLRALSNRLQENISSKEIIARLGGDEFAILMEPIVDISEAEKLAKTIQNSFSIPLSLGEQEIFVSVSIGIVKSCPEYQTPEEIFRDADIAMYRAKAAGKECYMVFDKAMHTEVLQKAQLQVHLRQAVEKLSQNLENQFKLYYQPIINLETKKIIGFEALLRWLHPQKGLIPPGKFIPIAEETGLIIPIGNWILKQACMQLSRWQKKYSHLHNLTLSINVSSCQFHQADFVTNFQEILQNYPSTPSCLKLEITESVLIDINNSTKEKLEELNAIGITLSLDDFGTGYSCLSYLYQLPIKTLKIDRSFVQRLEEGHTEIVNTIISLAHNLNMDVIAEGVETKKQLNMLKELNCELAQGFFFSKPVPEDIAENLLKSQR